MRNRTLIFAVLGIVLLGIGGLFWVYTVKMNKPIERLVPLPLSAIPEDRRSLVVADFAALADSDEVLAEVAKMDHMMDDLGVFSESEAIAEIRKRTRVDLSPDGNTMRTFASGIRKEMEMLNKLSMAVFDQTMKASRAREQARAAGSPTPSD